MTDHPSPTATDRGQTLHWHGQTFTIHPDRAMHWHNAQSLVLTDPHFGKCDSFRAGGVPVPDGALQRDLDRIEALMSSVGVRQLIILGDFFHNSASRSPGVLNTLALWIERVRPEHVLLVRGNHDRHAGDPPQEWGIDTRDSSCIWHGLTLWHDPADAAHSPAEPGMAGHVHPVVKLSEGRHTIGRLPCFYIQPNLITLPAFGSFTGGFAVRPDASLGERAIAVDGHQAVDVTPALHA